MNVDLDAAQGTPEAWAAEGGARSRFTLPALGGRVPALLALVILVFLVALAIFGDAILRVDPLAPQPNDILLSPSGSHPFGTDAFGRDVLARVVDATHRDLLIPALIVAFAAPVGAFFGVIAGYFGGPVSQVIMRLTDVVLSFPGFLLALVIVAVLGNGIGVVVGALAIANTPYFIRITRSRVLSERDLEYVEAAISVGNPGWRTALLHVLPNSVTPTLAQATLAFGWAILDTAGLAYLGVGIVPPTPEWGVMIGDGVKDVPQGVWWTTVFPGLFILLTALAANLIGVYLRERQE